MTETITCREVRGRIGTSDDGGRGDFTAVEDEASVMVLRTEDRLELDGGRCRFDRPIREG
jgi:hypothetical protein